MALHTHYNDSINSSILSRLIVSRFLSSLASFTAVIPKRYNESISQFLDMGHSDVFEVRVCQIDEEAHPEHQVHINVYIKRKEQWHPLRVMEMGKNAEEKIIGVLHDVVEDSDWTFEMLEEEGFTPEIIDALRFLTKLSEDEDYDHFISRVLTNPLAMKIKLYDIEDNLNLSRLGELTEADIARSQKYMRARARLKEALNEP